jgi:RNA polymerase sigma factor (sigma-70 family)
MARLTADAVRRHLQTLAARHGDDRATDRELLERFARQQDEAAFAALFRRHGDMVLAAGSRVLSNAHDAEDVCQAAFLLLARKAASRHWQSSVAGWLYQTAHLLALKARTAAARRARRERAAAAPAPSDTLAEITGQELQAALDEELLALPGPLRAPLVLCYLEGATRDEAARQLGCPLATLKNRLERGRERLRAALARRGLGLSALLPATVLARPAPDPAAAGVLARKTAAAALALAAGKAVDEVVSVPVSRLVRGGRGLLGWDKWRSVLAPLLLGGLLATAGAWAHTALPGGQVGPAPRDVSAAPSQDSRRLAAVPVRARGTTLRFRFRPGEQLHYVIESRIEMETSAPGFFEQVNATTHTYDVTWKVAGVDAEGNARVTLTVDRLRFVLDNSIAGRVEFDSKKHKMPVGSAPIVKARATILRAYAGSEFTCTVSPRGEVRDFTIPRKFADAVRRSPGLRLLHSPDSLQQQLACPGCVVLPGEALSRGVTWKEQTGTSVIGGLVRLAVYSRATYKGRADRGGKPLEEIALEPTVTGAWRTNTNFLGPLTLLNQDGKGEGRLRQRPGPAGRVREKPEHRPGEREPG